MTYTYTDGSNSTVQIDTLLSGTINKTVKSKADAYGRTIRWGINNGTNYDLTDTCYDNMGRVLFVSALFQNSFTASQTACSGFTDGAVYAYDTVGRGTMFTAKATSLSDRITNTSYTGNSIKVEDAGNGTTTLKKISRYDALGRLIDICQVSATNQQGTNNVPADCQFDISGTGFKTSYAYDVLNHLKQVTQGGLKKRCYEYDGLGRLTSVAIPEQGTLMDNTGPTTFTYTADGLVYQRTRPARP